MTRTEWENQRCEQHPQTCPTCGAKATDSTHHTNAMGVVTANLVCAHGHLWEIRYVAVEWPEAS